MNPDGISVRHFLLCVVFPLVSSCSFIWPFHAGRDFSLSEQQKSDVGDIERSYVISLLKLNKSRYLQLKDAGGEYCFPGQMREITDQHQRIINEIDIDLLGDASNTLSESFLALEKLRRMMEAKAEKDDCFIQYADELIEPRQKPFRSEDSALGLPDWPRPANVKTFMQGPQ